MIQSQVRQHGGSSARPTRNRSPAWLMRAAGPADPGRWSCEESLTFLNELLEGERAGAKALAHMAHDVRDPGVRALLREVETVQAAFCVTLGREIEARGGRASPAASRFYEKCLGQPNLKQRIAFANRGQESLARSIEAALRTLPAGTFHEKLLSMLELHRRQIERWKLLLG